MGVLSVLREMGVMWRKVYVGVLCFCVSVRKIKKRKERD